jgi:hypothetical protein
MLACEISYKHVRAGVANIAGCQTLPMNGLFMSIISLPAPMASNELANLSWSCTQCNLHKGSNIASIDPRTGERTQAPPRVDSRESQGQCGSRKGRRWDGFDEDKQK